ncbi:MAG: helix-turn-helix domain-containing protein [Mangrovibacterium sp.]
MITPLEPQCADSGRYNSKETAQILDINRATLRKHANEGYIRFGIRKSNNRRFFLGAEIKKYWRQQY